MVVMLTAKTFRKAIPKLLDMISHCEDVMEEAGIDEVISQEEEGGSEEEVIQSITRISPRIYSDVLKDPKIDKTTMTVTFSQLKTAAIVDGVAIVYDYYPDADGNLYHSRLTHASQYSIIFIHSKNSVYNIGTTKNYSIDNLRSIIVGDNIDFDGLSSVNYTFYCTEYNGIESIDLEKISILIKHLHFIACFMAENRLSI